MRRYVHVVHMTVVMRFIDVCHYCCVSSQCTGAIELSVFSEHFSTELDVVDIQTQRIDRFGEAQQPGRDRYVEAISCSQVKASTISTELSSSMTASIMTLSCLLLQVEQCYRPHSLFLRRGWCLRHWRLLERLIRWEKTIVQASCYQHYPASRCTIHIDYIAQT